MIQPISTSSIHTERVLQKHLISELVTNQGYLFRESKTDYDREIAMDQALVLRFIKNAQPNAWEKMTRQYGTSAEEELFKQLDRALKKRGLVDVLRNGIKLVPGIRLALCYFRPASGIEPKRVAEYESNILSAMEEVAYSQKNKNRIDMVLFVNGLPIVTIEAKNLPTGTTFRDAEAQYRKDRSPAGEPLLTFKRGALVHFALDEDLASMTTRLKNSKTKFLPFNRGRADGAGNPDIEGEHRIAYFYKSGDWGDAIFSRSLLLDVIGRFMHLQTKGKRAKMIFPRFQQLDCVRRLMADAKVRGAGENYLIQHSAGSGKSNTIAWLAHQAINLHDQSDRKVFDAAIVVSDRVVLDSQLQDVVGQFEQTSGVVKKIDKTSTQLKDAITDNKRIIVTTIQKFSTDKLRALSGFGDRNFALIVDEAHSGQSGRQAQAASDALTRNAAASSDDIEDIIAEYQKSRGPQKNISYFGFTATPRNVTLERFGTRGSDGIPLPFHLYPMRQAIEEGFILDVLQNYMTYKAYYELEKAIDEDPELSVRRAKPKVAQYANLHPTAIGQKVEIIVEHFRRHVMRELDRLAKAMIVTQGRRYALNYYRAVNEYLERKGYTELKALVAFSEFTLDGDRKRESDFTGFAETELPSRFDGFKEDGTPYPDTYQILIVANKFLTGFDQPKLCAMYVDKELAGLQAVQTLSRLNRTYAGKERTFVLDFRNSVEEIQDAFRPYYEATTLTAVSDPHQVYDLENRLLNSRYLNRNDIDAFARIFFNRPLRTIDRPRLEALVREAVSRFENDEDEGRKEEFRQLLKSFNRFYTFVAQVVTLEDTDLEKLYAYADWLSRMLPNREVPPENGITEEMLSLHAFRLDLKEQGSASLSAGDTDALAPIGEFGAKSYTEEEKKELSEIVREFNDRHGTDFSERDIRRFDDVNREILDDDLLEKLRNNAPDVVYSAFAEAFVEGVIRMFTRDKDMRNIVLTDAEAREKATRHFFQRALRVAREAV